MQRQSKLNRKVNNGSHSDSENYYREEVYLPASSAYILTSLIIALLDDWGLSAADQLALLALPAGTRAGAIVQLEWQALDHVWLMPRIELGALPDDAGKRYLGSLPARKTN